MEALHLLVADAANISREGKLNVLGIFNRINSRQFPALHPQMYIIAELIASPAEYDTEREINIKILDSDAQIQVVDWKRKIKVPHPSAVGEFSPSIRQILELKGVVFPKPDIYQVSILVDNDEKASTKLYVNEIQQT